MKEFADAQKEQFAKHMQQAMAHEDDDASPGTVNPGTQARKILEKEKLVTQLNARLVWWHQQLQNRKAALDPNNAAAVSDFNADAAAYAGLNEIANEKNQELASLRSIAKR